MRIVVGVFEGNADDTSSSASEEFTIDGEVGTTGYATVHFRGREFRFRVEVVGPAPDAGQVVPGSYQFGGIPAAGGQGGTAG